MPTQDNDWSETELHSPNPDGNNSGIVLPNPDSHIILPPAITTPATGQGTTGTANTAPESNAPPTFPLPDWVRLPQHSGWWKQRQVNKWVGRVQLQEDPDHPGYALVTPDDQRKMPRPGAREQAEWDEADWKKEIEATKFELRELALRKRGAKILVLGEIGGSGASTFVSWLAAMTSVDGGADVGVYDANHSMGVLAKRFDFFPEETLNQQQLYDSRAWYGASSENYRNDAKQHPTIRVTVVGASRIWKNKKQIFFGDHCKTTVNIAKSNHKFLFIDSMNDFSTDVGLQLLEEADLIVFTACDHKADSLWSLWALMDQVCEHGFEDKVRNGVIGITEHKPGIDIEKTYKPFLIHREYNHRGGHLEIRDYPKDREFVELPIINIPEDRHVASERVHPIENLARQTHLAIDKGLITLFKRLPDGKPVTPQEIEMFVREKERLELLRAQVTLESFQRPNQNSPTSLP